MITPKEQASFIRQIRGQACICAGSLAATAAQTLEVLVVLVLTILVGVVSQNAQKTFKLVFGFAVLGLILCVVPDACCFPCWSSALYASR